MTTSTFKALVVRETTDNNFTRTIENREIGELPKNQVLIKVSYAALNYKDALSASGHKGITRNYPHTPGIDAAGIVVRSADNRFKEGDEVIVTSYDLGMNTPGGFSEYISVPADWVVMKPEAFSLKESMIYGTAGFTAGLSLLKMEMMGQTPEMGPILVTGATGGVGSMAVAILSKAGYQVIASTGKKEEHEYLQDLGAVKCIDRDQVFDVSTKSMLRTSWAGAIDTVGGTTLSTVVRACGNNGNVAVCGLVESPALNITVYPLIIKGVNLLGIESAECNMEMRLRVWKKLASNWKVKLPASSTTFCSLQELNGFIDTILKGGVKGRVVVDLSL
jgi:acrylyl-CoA reductase (NADPH)